MAQVKLPEPDRAQPIVIAAEAGNHWRQGAYEVWLLRGNCRISQGAASARCNEAVLWIDRADVTQPYPSKIIAYLEGDVTIEPGLQSNTPKNNQVKLTDKTWFGRFHTSAGIQVHAAGVAGKPDVTPGIYLRGMERRSPGPGDAIRRTQFVEPGNDATGIRVLPPGTRSVEIYRRGNTPTTASWWEPVPNTNQWMGTVDGGVVFIVDTASEYGVIDISADRLVVWTTRIPEADQSGQTLQPKDQPLEIYLEGNIVFRQGDTTIYATRMYYDVPNKVGIVLDAEVLAPVRDYEGILRLKAEVLRQTGPDQYFAQNAFITSSRMGRPGYRIQSGNIYYEDIQRPAFDRFSGQPQIDMETGQPLMEHDRLATSENNFLFLGDVPIFYWPRLATDLTDPTFYIRRARLKNDSVYGTQILTNWDGYQLLGIRNPPAGTDWDVSLDYLGNRGFGHGTTFVYNRDVGFFRLGGPTSGLFDYWGIDDHGLDMLGRDRRDLVPPKDYRHRLFWQHRQELPADFQLSAEVGWLSDRNFLEEYFKREWDELKDETTGVELRRSRDNTSWSVTADGRLNEFFTQTEWLPRGDHFWLGQSLFGDVFTWYEHSSAGYARLRTANPPTDPNDAPFDLLPWELAPREGERLVTRQEIDWPFQLGPVKMVPYGLGELAHWGQDITGDDIQRAYWQAGMRASMPMWRAEPMVENQLFNVHGLAHKVVFDAEFSFAESNRDLDQFPLYDPLDDDSIEAFRRRLATNTFGGSPVPQRFDERFYALRTGMAGWVTAPSTEIADDLMAMRMGIRQRWQTKRGMPGNRRIIDWVVLDTNFTWFPDDTRDNYGESLGLLDYDFRWHVGDRLTLVSDGIFDFFADGQQIVTIGGFLTRPPRASLYLGMRLLDGPISHHILAMSYSYHMSPKWFSSFGTSVDIGGEGNIGQRFSITRVGESLLVSAGFSVDAARDNVGISFAVEPRFLPKGRLGRIGGAQIPVAGAFGLE